MSLTEGKNNKISLAVFSRFFSAPARDAVFYRRKMLKIQFLLGPIHKLASIKAMTVKDLIWWSSIFFVQFYDNSAFPDNIDFLL